LLGSMGTYLLGHVSARTRTMLTVLTQTPLRGLMARMILALSVQLANSWLKQLKRWIDAKKIARKRSRCRPVPQTQLMRSGEPYVQDAAPAHRSSQPSDPSMVSDNPRRASVNA
jgi:putative SOS response-associated peptidase YedK